MPEQDKKPSLTQFMKKQMSEKSTKKTAAKSATPNKPSKDGDKKKDGEKSEENKEESQEEEMTEEEELEEAKKASRNKAAEQDRTEMFKKLFLENIVKYTIVIAVFVIFAIGIIKFGAAILAFLNGLLYKVLMGALGHK